MGHIRIVQLQLRTIQGMRNKMNKVFYLILISLFSLTIISLMQRKMIHQVFQVLRTILVGHIEYKFVCY